MGKAIIISNIPRGIFEETVHGFQALYKEGVGIDVFEHPNTC